MQTVFAAEAPQVQTDEGALNEIIVTAQRRSESLTEVPIAIVVQNASQLERSAVTNIRDLTVVTPGLRITGLGANVEPSIRGIHSDQTDPGNDPNVAVYVDGVYQSNQIGNNFELADIDHIEVLKGPQGTLFGRNATGGAIRVFTREPSFQPTGNLDVGYGKLDEVSVKGYVSGPLVQDVLAASVSGFYLDNDGYTHDIISDSKQGGIRSYGGRLKLLFRPVSNLSVNLIGAVSHRHDENATAYEPYNGNTTGRVIPGAIFPTETRQVAIGPGFPAFADSRTYTGALKLDWDTTVGTFSSTSAYNRTTAGYSTDAEFAQLNLLRYPIFEKQRDLSQELIYSSKPLGIVQLTAGAFYYHAVGRYDPLIVEGAFVNPTLYGYTRQATDAYAGFGEATIAPTDRISLIVGARYSHERRKAAGTYLIAEGRPDTLPALGTASFNSFTPRASIRYNYESGDNIYFTYSRGFKSGGFNVSGLSPDPFDPERVEAFEVGLKTSPSRTMAGNFSVFYYNYTDQQVASNVNGFNVTANAASSHIYGADADIAFRATEEFTATLGLSYLHARFNDYRNAVVNTPIALPDGTSCLCGNNTTVDDLSGGAEPYSPKFTAGVTANYRKEIGIGTLNLSASFYDTSKFFYDNNARVSQPSYATVSARASLEPAGTKFNVYIWGKNLTNRLYTNTTFISNTGDGATWAPPRTYGVGVKYQF